MNGSSLALLLPLLQKWILQHTEAQQASSSAMGEVDSPPTSEAKESRKEGRTHPYKSPSSPSWPLSPFAALLHRFLSPPGSSNLHTPAKPCSGVPCAAHAACARRVCRALPRKRLTGLQGFGFRAGRGQFRIGFSDLRRSVRVGCGGRSLWEGSTSLYRLQLAAMFEARIPRNLLSARALTLRAPRQAKGSLICVVY